jgi:transcriptional regulator with XRE-family HTH domain
MGQVGERLKEHRLRHGLSKRTLARQIGVSAPTVVRWEEGSAIPNDYNLYRIEQVLAESPPRGAGLPQGTRVGNPEPRTYGTRAFGTRIPAVCILTPDGRSSLPPRAPRTQRKPVRKLERDLGVVENLIQSSSASSARSAVRSVRVEPGPPPRTPRSQRKA